MAQMNRTQRCTLAALGLANLIALSAVGMLLLRAPSTSDNVSPLATIATTRQSACRQATSRALLDAGHSGLVHTREDGTVMIQLQRRITTGSLRLHADAATWAAFEAVAGHGDCLDFDTVQVTVLFTFSSASDVVPREDSANSEEHSELSPSVGQELHTMALADMADLMTWSLGLMDDAELTRRIEYWLPLAAFQDSTGITPGP